VWHGGIIRFLCGWQKITEAVARDCEVRLELSRRSNPLNSLLASRKIGS
jgi:hypothetical protein